MTSRYLARKDAQEIYDEYEEEVDGLLRALTAVTTLTPNDVLNYQTAIMVATQKRMLACELRRIEVLDEIKCELANQFNELRIIMRNRG